MKNLLPNPYLLALGVSLLSYMVIWGVKLLFSTRIAKFVGNTHNKWDDLVVFTVEKTSYFFMLGVSLYVGVKFMGPSKIIHGHADRAFFIILMWQIAIWSHHLMDKWISSAITRRTKRNPAAASSISLIQVLSRMILFSFIFLFTLSNLGIKITTIIAGLGIGGVAVALALQKILGDLFSSLSIVLDKPFVVGDFIIIDQFLGEVEKIGLKTTRIRSLGGEQVIFSNSDLLGARIRNFKRMHERRIAFVLQLPLTTPSVKLRTAVSIISAIVSTKKRVRFDRCHFMKLANTSADIELVYWVLSDDYNLHMDIQQEILFEIKDAFEGEGITFAYPIQTLQILPTEIHMRQEQGLENSSSRPVNSIIS